MKLKSLQSRNCEAYSSFEEVFSDHRILTAKIHQSLCRNKNTVKTTDYDRFLVTNRNISSKYMVAVRNKFNTLQEKSERYTLNDKYENFITAHMEAAVECIPTKLKVKYRVPWEPLMLQTGVLSECVNEIFHAKSAKFWNTESFRMISQI